MLRIFSFCLALVLSAPAMADEGMWLPMLLNRNYEDMKEHGLKLSPEELYSINNSSLKDAIVSLGGFCTGEIISSEGLMLTNHHCGFDAIRSHSTVGHNYLEDGFWAMDRSAELPNEGLFVRFLVSMHDVSNVVNRQLHSGMSEDERAATIARLSDSIAGAAAVDHYEAEVESFYRGNEFYLFIYEKFTDVRLVGAPPSSIGKFGGDTDNWMWPRHTGDFSIFRIYAGPDGKPADYSPDNVPLTPKHHLPVSIGERKEGDFAMIFGYPGSTDRYLSSWGVKEAIELSQPSIVEIRDVKLGIMREAMDSDEAVSIQLASNYASTANYWKYYMGQQEQLVKNKVFDKKKKIEAEFAEWVNADAARKAEYGQALELLREAYAANREYAVSDVYVLEAGLLGNASVLHALRFSRALASYAGFAGSEEMPAEKVEALKNQLIERAENHYSELHLPTDRKLMVALWGKYKNDIDATQQPAFFTSVVDSVFGGSFEAFADSVYSASVYTDLDRLKAWLDNPDLSLIEDDYLARAANDLFAIYQGAGSGRESISANMEKGYRLFIAGLRKMNPDVQYAPDANSTMRVTYGNVLSYSPVNGAHYNYYTTLEGVMQKMNNNDPEFVVPEKLVELYNRKDYGQYANKDGKLTVCFISNNDITGGNSGSPVINGRGELIGTAFDGNWEAMSGDIAFEEDKQRTISTDIRYVLFIIDKYAGAGHLIDEMTIVKPRKKFLGIF